MNKQKRFKNLNLILTYYIEYSILSIICLKLKFVIFQITLDFNGIHLKTYQFSLDLDFSSQYNLRIFHNTFSYLKKLRILYLNLNKRIDLIVVVNLVDSTFLEELTIQNSFLKQVNSNFCNNKHHLKKIDFSNNDFESLAFIFDHCYNLNLLDLSYNRLGMNMIVKFYLMVKYNIFSFRFPQTYVQQKKQHHLFNT